MTDQLCGVEIAKAFDHPVTTFAVCVAKRTPEGPALLLLVALFICAAAVPFVFRYYLGVLAQGAALEGSPERQDYDKLRASLAGGNLAARLYVERFFGDYGVADRTLFPHAFGLKKPAPLWTAPAFDRCLLLALLYPIATIFLIWTVSGHVGPAEKALLLPPDISGWWRVFIAAASFGFASFAIWRGLRAPGWKSLALINVAGAVSIGVANTIAVAFAAYLADAFAGIAIAIGVAAAAGAAAGAVAGAGAGAFAVVMLSLALALSLTLLPALPLTLLPALPLARSLSLSQR